MLDSRDRNGLAGSLMISSASILRLQLEMAEIQFLKERIIGLGTRAVRP
jgi:hypothetical protein